MGRKRFIEEVEIKTLVHTYMALLRQDPDTGMIHTGLCDHKVVEKTRELAIGSLRKLADEDSGITYAVCLVVDPGLSEPEVEEYLVAVLPTLSSPMPITAVPEVQYVHRGDGLAQVRVGPLPKRWVVRVHTPHNMNEMDRRLAELREARSVASGHLLGLAAMVSANPVAAILTATDTDED